MFRKDHVHPLHCAQWVCAQKQAKLFDAPPSLKVRIMMAVFMLAQKRGLA